TMIDSSIAYTHLKCRVRLGFCQPRSRPFRHHVMIAWANSWAGCCVYCFPPACPFSTADFRSSLRSSSFLEGFSRRNQRVKSLIAVSVCQQCPDDACVLVGQSDGSDVSVSPRDQSFEPLVGSLLYRRLAHRGLFPAPGGGNHRTRTMNEQRPQVAIAAFADTQ